MNKILGAGALVASFAFVLVIFMSHFSFEQERSIASIHNSYDLTCLTGDKLNQAIVRQIVKGFRGVRENGYMGLTIGHYIYSDSQPEQNTACANSQERGVSSAFSLQSKRMACDQFPVIHFRFIADGESVNGSKRQMDIEAPCRVSDDMGRTAVVWIPWQQLADETPFEGVSEYKQPTPVTVKTQNITDEWPSKWALDEIRLIGKDGSVKVSSDEIKEIAGRAIVLDFKNQL